jgi:hypothetical protein
MFDLHEQRYEVAILVYQPPTHQIHLQITLQSCKEPSNPFLTFAVAQGYTMS